MRKRPRESLDRGRLDGLLGLVAVQQVKFDVRAWGFQLRGVSRRLDGPGVAEAQREDSEEDAQCKSVLAVVLNLLLRTTGRVLS